MNFHIIYTKSKMLLSKKPYNSWREIQDEYDDYKASLEFDSIEEIEDYLILDYPDLKPSAKVQIAEFMALDSETKELTFDRV